MRRYLSAACAALLLVLVPVASASAVTAKVAVGNSSAGSILIDGHGKSLYRFGRDTGRKSTCNGACAQNWPPLLTKGKPKASGSAKASKLGTTKRSDGTTQVTYGGWPVYTFVADKNKPGSTKGEGVDAFGAKWYVVAAKGTARTGSY